MKFSLTILLIALCSRDSTCQTPYCTRFNNTGPDLPQLPDQYQTTIEVNLVDKGQTITGAEYYDGPGNQATLQMRQNNSLFTLVYDYENDQLFYIYGNGTCLTEELSTDSNNVFFGNRTIAGMPHVFSTGGVLHFASTFGEEYMGTATVRGVLVDHWRSCQYWPQVNSNFTLDYYFSARNWSDPIAIPQIPVRAVANGTMATSGGPYSFLHYYDFIDFRFSIPDDSTIFETPKGVICANRKDAQPVPQLPDFFHYRQEIILQGQTAVFQADVWYDKTYKYIRYDYRTLSPSPPLNTTNPITEIHDYNFGVRYVKDQVTGRCISGALVNSTFDVSEKQTVAINGTNVYAIHMKNPMALFYLNSDYAYTGKRTARGLTCKVFTALRPDYDAGDGSRHSAIFEYYFLDDQYFEVPDDGSTYPKGVPVFLEVTVQDLAIHVMYNFLDFDEGHPDYSLFDVSSCYSETAKLQFQIRFPGAYKTGTSGQLLADAGSAIRAAANVNPIRVQDIRLDYDNSQVFVSGTIIDRSPGLAQFTFLSAQEIEKNDEFTFSSNAVHNVTECAQKCVGYSDFVCQSFDFCPLDPDNVCRLSKAHIGDGGVVVKASACNHFSRTVVNPGQSEPSLTATLAMLQNAVYGGQITADVNIEGLDDPITYTAVDIQVTFGYLTPKPLPTLSGQFSYHLEITVPQYQQVFNSHIYYDSDFQLVRYDLVNTQPSPPLFTIDPISTIHDYSSGLSYTLDVAQGNCTIAPIGNTSFDVGVTGNAGYVVKMKSPLDLFYLNGSYKYAGQQTIRGILCDVFETVRTDFRFGNNPLNQPAVFQFYFMSSDWHELSEDSGAPVLSQPIALVISSSVGGFTLTYDFYDFSEQHPDLSNFDIRPCYAGQQLRHFLIKFAGNYHPTLDTNLKKFTKNVQQMLSFYTTASFIRFQDPTITYSDDGYVYYLATMVEQAPYLLDFTKTSNNVAVYNADKIISDVTSPFTCAAFCRNETTFSCEGFDYCQSAGKCQLSQKHAAQSGQAIRPSDICDHYSKTVDNVAPVEPTVGEAFIILKDVVYGIGLNVTVHDDVTGQNVVYKALLFDEDILRPDSTATTSTNLAHFIPARHGVIVTSPDAQLTGVSVDQCAARCLSEATFDCQSFGYCFDTGRCYLSTQRPDQRMNVTQTRMPCDLYSRSYVDNYVPYPGQTLQAQGDVTITDVQSVNFCAERCSKSTTADGDGIACKSFDYCYQANVCILKSKHLLDMASSTLKSSGGSCSHFSRKYISDFDQTTGRVFTTSVDLQFSNVSKDACAKLCMEYTADACRAFTYCMSSSVCVITALDPKLNRNNISANASCDVYTRNYFSSNSGNTSPQSQQQASTRMSSGYSGGAMAGLAFAMLIPGMVIGAALLYFLRTKRLVREEQLRMGFIPRFGTGGRRLNEKMDGDMEPIDDPHDAPPAHVHAYDSPQ
ncbi:uncharacterized protein LOC127834810 [Dreissena polymorpha]|uniref:uncharacterized protein LOC127834810 n=1 Tax=Dreissena polymorpha TaxID=45954 RepID=UPI00226512C8|nr:uncharacterized protein LOC127834810 [Dreissena polymorpha]